MRGVTIDVSVNLVTETCCRSDCGILFAVPEPWQQQRRRDHSDFYYPNGHSQHYTAKTQEEQLRAELATTRASLEYHRKRGNGLEDQAVTLRNKLRAQKGVATRLRNKAAAGVCGFCDHRFPDLAAHVQAEHPDEASTTAEADDE